MDAARQRLRVGLLTALVLAWPATGVWSQSPSAPLPPGLVPVAVHDDRCECVLPTPHVDDQFYLIVGSLARDAGPRQVTITTEPCAGPVSVPLEKTVPDPGWDEQIRDSRACLARARQQQQAGADYPPVKTPPKQRVFHVFARGGDLRAPGNYVKVIGELRAVGQHCQVYLDSDQANPAGLQSTVDDIVRTFDREVYPSACRVLGRALDVDRDGRFTILLTGWLGKMAGGKVSLSGFVRGSDFCRDLAAPFGNGCDMMYLNTDLKPGPYLHTLLAHEYTHAVVFSEHVFGSYLPELPRQDEEGWLNEGLAHLAEDLHGYSWANLDYRISAFLSAPERYQLVVPDYYRAGLWRSHGNRGATFLFLRWCQERYGPDVLTHLVQTNLSGVRNVEVTTGQHFDDLFRQWTVALALSGSHVKAEGIVPLSAIDLHQALGTRLLCGPNFEQVSLAEGHHEFQLAGTAAAYLLLHSPGDRYSRITISAEAGTDLQVSLVRLPRRTARISLCCQPGEAANSCRLVLTVHGRDVTLDAAAWERLVPRSNRADDTSYRALDGTASPPGVTNRSVQGWFGDPHLKAGETRTSAVIALPASSAGTSSWVFKVAATDAAGHRLSAWALP